MTLREKMHAVMDDVNTQVAEREELVEAIATALLTRKNLFILGAPGQAKSYAVNEFRRRITGARQFERLLSKQTDEDQLFGRIDLSSLIPGAVPQSILEADAGYVAMRSQLADLLNKLPATPDSADALAGVRRLSENLSAYQTALAQKSAGEPTVLTAGKIPESDICFLDEIFKCNDGVLNSLLTALNERKYTNEGRTYLIPTISFVAASNEIPNFNDPQEKILAALYDRLELKVVTDNVQDRDKRLAVLKSKQAGSNGAATASITLNELVSMQQEVAVIPVTDAVNELADEILCELRRNGLTVSDRKYLNYYPIAQARAWLSGHTQVESLDLLALKNYLWQTPGDRPLVESTLSRLCVNPLQDKVSDILGMATAALEDFQAAKDAMGSKALVKFRGESLRLYGMYCELEQRAGTDSERKLLSGLLDVLEKNTKEAYDAVGFTYTRLAEMAALQ